MYPVSTRRVFLDRFIELYTGGELHDAMAIAALCLTQHFLQQEAK